MIRPLGHRRLVRDEEVVHLPRDEPGSRGLAADDVEDVFAIEVTMLAKEVLLAVVVVFGAVLVVTGDAAVGSDGIAARP